MKSREEKAQENKIHFLSGNKRCGKCGVIKPLNDFYKNKGHYSGYMRICKKCNIAKVKAHNTTYYGHFKKLLYNIKTRNKSHQLGSDKDFDINYILRMASKQEYKCYFSGIAFKLDNSFRSPYKPSIDRLDSDKPYIKDNIVLSCQFINYARNNTNEVDTISFLHELKESLNKKDLTEL